MRNIVNGLLIRQGTVLLAKRSPDRQACANMWSFPGGHIEGNETLLEALARELLEEIGITPLTVASLGSIGDPNSGAKDPATYHLYAISDWDGGEPKLIGAEHTELAWFPLQAACALPDLALEEYKALFRSLASK